MHYTGYPESDQTTDVGIYLNTDSEQTTGSGIESTGVADQEITTSSESEWNTTPELFLR